MNKNSKICPVCSEHYDERIDLSKSLNGYFFRDDKHISICVKTKLIGYGCIIYVHENSF